MTYSVLNVVRNQFFCGFDNNTNNTDTSDETMRETEERIDGEHIAYVSATEPTQTTGAYQNESEFVFSILQGKKPTLLFRNGDFINGHKIKLVDLSH